MDTDQLRCPDGITAPAANAILGADTQIQYTAGQAYDGDYLTHGYPPPDLYADTFEHSDAYTWAYSGGGGTSAFQSNGGNGSSVTWTTPAGYGTYTIQCTIKDDADDMMGGTNTRADWPMFPLVKTRSVYVVSCYVNVDSNNDGTINSSDDSTEETAPGKYVKVNDDDDNSNNYPDNSSYDNSTVTGENDLIPVNIGYNAGSANINGYKLYITVSGGIKLWTSSTKGTQITSGSYYTIGTDTIPATLYAEGETAGAASITITIKNGSTEVTHDIAVLSVVDVDFIEDVNQSYGFDNLSIRDTVYKSIALDSTDSVGVTIDSVSQSSSLFFRSSRTPEIAVYSGPAATSPYSMTIDSSYATTPGTSYVMASMLQVQGIDVAALTVKAYEPFVRKLAVRVIHQGSNGVQEIPYGQGKPNAVSINTGEDGICQTEVFSFDGQNDDYPAIIPVGWGKPNTLCITAGNNGLINSTPQGDDEIVAGGVSTGANGICNTQASLDDVQVIPIGNGEPFAPCVTTGADGICTTDAYPGDSQVIQFGYGEPNQVCILPGPIRLDSIPATDDGMTVDNINTGANGKRDTPVPTEYQSADIPSLSAITSYLNNTVYKQAACSFDVQEFSPVYLNFDIDLDSKIDVGDESGEEWLSNEMQRIITYGKVGIDEEVYDDILFFVDNPHIPSLPIQPQIGGIMELNQPYGFIFCARNEPTKVPCVSAHELGHGAFALAHTDAIDYKGVPATSHLMYYQIATPPGWRLFASNWDKIQLKNN